MKKVLAAIAIIALAGCYNDKADKLYPTPSTSGCDTTTSTYGATVQPIVAQYCAISGCHDAASAQFGYDFSNYNGVKLAADNGKLVLTIKHDPGEQYPMPNNGVVLDACTVNKIVRWVNLGAKND